MLSNGFYLASRLLQNSNFDHICKFFKEKESLKSDSFVTSSFSSSTSSRRSFESYEEETPQQKRERREREREERERQREEEERLEELARQEEVEDWGDETELGKKLFLNVKKLTKTSNSNF